MRASLASSIEPQVGKLPGGIRVLPLCGSRQPPPAAPPADFTRPPAAPSASAPAAPCQRGPPPPPPPPLDPPADAAPVQPPPHLSQAPQASDVPQTLHGTQAPAPTSPTPTPTSPAAAQAPTRDAPAAPDREAAPPPAPPPTRSQRPPQRGDLLVFLTTRMALLDVKVVQLLARSHLRGASREAGATAEKGERQKRNKYDAVTGAARFIPLVHETCGRVGRDAYRSLQTVAEVAAGHGALSKRTLLLNAMRDLSTTLRPSVLDWSDGRCCRAFLSPRTACRR
eukprot:jgi/Ulvmu1/10679/UM067_0003.1